MNNCIVCEKRGVEECSRWDRYSSGLFCETCLGCYENYSAPLQSKHSKIFKLLNLFK
jgi:hypothetical protein